MIKTNDKVYYQNNQYTSNKYEVVSDVPGISLKNSQYVFGYDNDGFPLHSFEEKYDFVLAEYDKAGNFIKNIACTRDEVEKANSIN